MRSNSTIALMVVVFAACASPAAAGLIISFSAMPSVIDVGQTSTIELVLTPVLSDPDDRIALRGFVALGLLLRTCRRHNIAPRTIA